MTQRASVRILFLAALIALAVGCKKKESSEPLGAKTGGVPTSREGQMFLLGVKLSQAALVNGRVDPAVVDRTFHAASKIAEITLHRNLAPLPTPKGDTASDTADALHYLLKGEGQAIARQVGEDFGKTAESCLELAVKLNMVTTLYTGDPKDTLADSLGSTLGKLASETKLDAELAPLLAKIKAHASNAQVTDMVLDLDKTLPVAIARVYEKS